MTTLMTRAMHWTNESKFDTQTHTHTDSQIRFTNCGSMARVHEKKIHAMILLTSNWTVNQFSTTTTNDENNDMW